MVEYIFRTGETAEAKALALNHHYSRRWPSAVVLIGTLHEPGGLFGDRGPAFAACLFSHPPARWAEPVLELIRLVRVPDLDAPLTSLIAQTCREAKAVTDLVVSYASVAESHHGGIYQAASWRYCGMRARRSEGLMINGEVVPGRQANNLFGTQSVERLAEQGVTATPIYDEGKHLYWRALNRKGKAKAKRLGLKSLPYPKPDR